MEAGGASSWIESRTSHQDFLLSSSTSTGRIQQGEPEPDWIGSIEYQNDFVYTGGYDGSVVIHDDALKTIASAQAHSGPIKCLATSRRENGDTMIATGSMDQTLVTHSYDASSKAWKSMQTL